MKQVRVLIVEDEKAKQAEIAGEISAFFGGEVRLDECDTFGEATQKILRQQFDLIVMDLLLPRRRDDDEAVDVSEELIDHLAASDLNRLTTTVAISKFDDVVAQRSSAFIKAGIFLIRYAESDDWKSCLRVCMQKVAFKTVYDFVVICALDHERSAFSGVNQSNFAYGDLVCRHGLDGREIAIGDLKGICVLQPRMGLVDAGITASRALSTFSPKLICMAGICGGFEGKVPLGTLLVSNPTWEHQAGKWRGDDFELRSFHESLHEDTRITLSQLIESDKKLATLASESHQIQVPSEEAELAPTVSGSAVIASAKYAAQIRQQHGQVSGVDMEVYGVYRAAALYGQPVTVFAAKTVVDFADEGKSNDLQLSGAILSARFVVKAIEQLMVVSASQP